jgi:hypothetical protein
MFTAPPPLHKVFTGTATGIGTDHPTLILSMAQQPTPRGGVLRARSGKSGFHLQRPARPVAGRFHAGRQPPTQVSSLRTSAHAHRTRPGVPHITTGTTPCPQSDQFWGMWICAMTCGSRPTRHTPAGRCQMAEHLTIHSTSHPKECCKIQLTSRPKPFLVTFSKTPIVPIE